jgi:hypothetical protein
MYLSMALWLYSPLLDLGRFFSFLIFYAIDRTPWTGDQPIPRPLPAHRTAQTQKKRGQTGRAIAEAVSRWLPTAAARGQSRA